MRDLLGNSVENASEHHSVINARVGIAEDLEKIVPKFARGGIIAEVEKEKMAIIDELPGVFFPIKEKCDLMNERHELAKKLL